MLVHLEELAPDAPAQCLPDTITVKGGDARVLPSLAFGIRECKETLWPAAAVVVVRNRKGCAHLSPWFVLIWRPMHTFGGWVRCRIQKGLEPAFCEAFENVDGQALRLQLAGHVAPSCIALVVLENGGFIECDQDEAKASDGWEPIWAWEFCPIVVLLIAGYSSSTFQG
jgi:hypothetical protein